MWIWGGKRKRIKWNGVGNSSVRGGRNEREEVRKRARKRSSRWRGTREKYALGNYGKRTEKSGRPLRTSIEENILFGDRPLWWLLYPGRGSDAYKMSKVQLTLLSQTTIAAREGRATHSPAFARRFIVLLHRWRHYRQTLNADGRCPLREKKVDGWKREWHRSNKTNVHV